jgi:hypothetical protein
VIPVLPHQTPDTVPLLGRTACAAEAQAVFKTSFTGIRPLRR